MTEINLKTKIIPRHDISSTWTEFNPVLLKGEIGIEIDTGKMKIGDGESDWNSLQYMYNSIDISYIDELFN